MVYRLTRDLEPKAPPVAPAKLRFFKLREAAAHRQQRSHGEIIWFVSGKKSMLRVSSRRDVNTLGIVVAVSTQQRRHARLGIA
jgi:uncharacterized protein YbgA (DUF1722 family)